MGSFSPQYVNLLRSDSPFPPASAAYFQKWNLQNVPKEEHLKWSFDNPAKSSRWKFNLTYNFINSIFVWFSPEMLL